MRWEIQYQITGKSIRKSNFMSKVAPQIFLLEVIHINMQVLHQDSGFACEDVKSRLGRQIFVIGCEINKQISDQWDLWILLWNPDPCENVTIWIGNWLVCKWKTSEKVGTVTLELELYKLT